MLKRIINYLKSNQIDCHANKSAFTLAETLIVMGIIGVVAALTLPNLNSSTGDKEKVVKLKKIYSNLEDAFGRAQVVYGPWDEWFSNDKTSINISKRMGERMTEFMKISKSCSNNYLGCMAKKYSYVTDTNGFDMYNDLYYYVLSDGTGVAFDGTIDIYVDIDGPNKGPNTVGKDFFVFLVDDNNNSNLRIVPNGLGPFGEGCDIPADDAYDAACWVIYNDNMDYLKCPEKLSNTVTSCK